MVAKKHKSKRVSLSQKYKIEKKVRDHRKKQKKLAKKNPQPKRNRKDPGIPSQWPFKEELLNEIQTKKENKLEEMVRRNALRQQAFEEMQKGEEMEQVQETYEVGRQQKFYKAFQKVVAESDVILECLDVRDPLHCRSKQIEDYILEQPNKRLILVLTKIDLVPKEVTEKWMQYFKKIFPCIPFKASTQQQKSHLSSSNSTNALEHAQLHQTSQAVGGQMLLGLLKNYCRFKGSTIKSAIRVGVIGFPNVGKSSLINSLKRERVCQVGNMPGVTKELQLIHLDKFIHLLDTPGIIFAQKNQHLNENSWMEAVLMHSVQLESVKDFQTPIEAIVQRFGKESLCQFYHLKPCLDTKDFLVQLAREKGKLKKGGIPDLEEAAKFVLRDWHQGKIPYYTLPPVENTPANQEQVQIVQEWSREFDLDGLLNQTTLPDTKDNKGFIKVSSGMEVEVDMEAEPEEVEMEYESEEEEDDDEDLMETDSEEDDE